ncbi:MAG TPA: molecular chaperone HtpG [Aestuariivirgaceae bacterium]|jgi:molecular chaperone HtpG
MATAKQAKGQQPEAHAFQAEVSKLLDLMVHSVYSEREVFLRELVSNAADALDKLRYESIANPQILSGDSNLKITIKADKAARTITVADTGIGMSRQELVDNLGTIARSGTQAFVEQAKQGSGDLHLIGQFGVGFYSSFIVAEKVDVISRRAGEEETWLWSSDGRGSFTIEPSAEALTRGSKIVLHLKKDAEEFLDSQRVETIAKTYSDHIAHPIMLSIGEEVSKQVNSASALWARPKTDITADQYKEFFGHVAGDYSEPALTLHYRAEGRNEYTVLLFVPGERPFDLFDPERRGRLKLYVRRVFITDDADILPAYLRFVRGIIDSEDMPLNISREMLQNNPTVAQIRKAVTSRVLAELKKCAEKDQASYAKIWNAFGPVIKEGLYEDMERRDQLYEVVRFASNKGNDVSLKNYVGRMKPNQASIYYLTGEDAERARRSPQLEGFNARDVEVLLLTDPVDSFWVRTALGYEGKPFKSVTQGSADLDAIPFADGSKTSEEDGSVIATLIAAIKQTLGDQVKDVRRSTRLTDSAVCIVADTMGLDRTLEKLLTRQGGTGIKVSAAILEINPTHPLVKALAEKLKAKGVTPEFEDAARLLLDEAHILEGEPVSDPPGFAKRLTELMRRAV